ncbi:MAG TPA: rod shape-determining protein MreC [Candidatus Saccharimonadia bacterium]
MKHKSVNRRLVGFMLVGLLLAIANTVGLLSPVTALASAALKPLQASLAGAASGVGGWFNVIGSARELGNENQRLRAEVAALRGQMSRDTEIKAQNDQLRQQLGVGGIRPDRLIAAEVIGYQPDNFRQFLTIGRGSRDGLREGMTVIQQGALIGRLQDVGPSTAKVFLIIDPNFRVAALDQNAPNRPTGTIRGQIGNGLIMDKIAQTETITPGDTIVTSGLGGGIEKGLIVGRVQTVSKQANGVFQTAQVTTDIQFNRLEVIYVIARPQ